MMREEAARCQTEGDRREIQLQKETQLKQEAILQLELQKEATARQRAAAQKQAEETRKEMLEQKDMQLKQEATRQLELHQDAIAQQSAAARKRAEETREMRDKWRETQKLHMKALEEAPASSIQKRQLQKMKQQEADQQRRRMLIFSILLAGQ